MQIHDPFGATPGTLKHLLCGEISAAQSYERALQLVNGCPAGARLRQIFADHSQAVGLLRDMLIRYPGEMPTTSGAWGSFADAVQATANVLGDTAALRVLKEGEEHGIREYQRVLHDPNVAEDAKAMSRSLLERCRSHVPLLDALIDRP